MENSEGDSSERLSNLQKTEKNLSKARSVALNQVERAIKFQDKVFSQNKSASEELQGEDVLTVLNQLYCLASAQFYSAEQRHLSIRTAPTRAEAIINTLGNTPNIEQRQERSVGKSRAPKSRNII